MSSDSDINDLHILIRDLRPGQTIRQFFQLRSVEVHKTRSGQDYIELALGDRTGSIPGKMWADVIRICGRDFKDGDYVRVSARVEVFNERLQVIVKNIQKTDQSAIGDLSELIKVSKFDPEALFGELKQIAATLQPVELAGLVVTLLDDNSQTLQECQAARMIHHAYRGGLIEHIVTVTRKVETIVSVEDKIDRNLAIAGAILHDLGKIRELNDTRQGRTMEGRLIGHVILGMDMVRDAALKRGIEARPWFRELQHIILSHHGEAEFGAPVRPATREAILVHFIDNLDSQLKIMEEALEYTDSEGFSNYNKWLEGRVFAGYQAISKEEPHDRDPGKAG